MEKWQEIMSAPITPEEMEWKVQSKTLKNDKCKSLYVCYFTRAVAIARLNEAFGLNWSASYTTGGFVHHKEYGDGTEDVTYTECTIHVLTDNGLISRSDRASSSDVEPAKSGVSNSFKRAVSKYGMGLELYKYPKVYVECTGSGQSKNGYYAPKDSVLQNAWVQIYQLVQSGKALDEYFIDSKGQVFTYEFGWAGKRISDIPTKPVNPTEKPFTAKIQAAAAPQKTDIKLLKPPPIASGDNTKYALWLSKWDGKIHKAKDGSFEYVMVEGKPYECKKGLRQVLEGTDIYKSVNR